MHFQIETTRRVPIYRQLMEQVREGIARGRLTPGEKLPSVRDLSREVVVNPNTVARVYNELEREGVLNTRPGLGVFVAKPSVVLTEEVRTGRLLEGLDRFLTEAVHLGFSEEEVARLFEQRRTQFQWTVREKVAPAGGS